MLAKRIITCLDVKEGRTVKGVHFNDLKDAGDIVELAKKYSVAGADGGDVQLGADDLGLSALTSTRCAQQDQIHRIIPFLC